MEGLLLTRRCVASPPSSRTRSGCQSSPPDKNTVNDHGTYRQKLTANNSVYHRIKQFLNLPVVCTSICCISGGLSFGLAIYLLAMLFLASLKTIMPDLWPGNGSSKNTKIFTDNTLLDAPPEVLLILALPGEDADVGLRQSGRNLILKCFENTVDRVNSINLILNCNCNFLRAN